MEPALSLGWARSCRPLRHWQNHHRRSQYQRSRCRQSPCSLDRGRPFPARLSHEKEPMREPGSDIVIVGAGIVGAACALECVRAGLRTTVVEAALFGGGATAAGMGHLVVMDDSEAQFALTHYSRSLWDELEAELPAEVQFRRCGTLWAAADEEEMREVRRKCAFYTQRGVAAEMLDGRQLVEAEPNLRDGLASGLRIPGDCVIYPPCAARWLIEQAAAGGAVIREQT